MIRYIDKKSIRGLENLKLYNKSVKKNCMRYKHD